jgi:hypothetical protein
MKETMDRKADYIILYWILLGPDVVSDVIFIGVDIDKQLSFLLWSPKVSEGPGAHA